MFRYERPQKGRQRQFHQVGVEAFGVGTPDLDVELLLLGRAMWRALGVGDLLTLELNSIGSPEARAKYKEGLVAYLEGHKTALDEDSQRRLTTNPLRILDSKNPDTQALLAEAPELYAYLDDASREDFERLCELLESAGLEYRVNQRLVRGLDYYNKSVFEWTTTALGAQGTVCGGGRYDGMVGQFGGRDTPGAGFAIGLERLALLVESLGTDGEHSSDLYVVVADDAAQKHALSRIETLREHKPAWSIQMHLGGGSFKSQFKRADKSGAAFALVYGETEVSNNEVTVKPLRSGGEQVTVADNQLVTYLSQRLSQD